MVNVDLGTYNKNTPAGKFDRDQVLVELETYLRYKKRHSENNIRNTMTRCRRLLYQFGVRIPTAEDAVRVEETLRARGNQDTTIIHNLHALELLAEHLGAPLHVVMPKKHRPVIEFLDQVESRLLIESCRNLREHAMVMTLLYCGLRLGELVRLDLEDVDLQHRLLYVKKTKTRKDRQVAISKECARILQAWLKHRPQLDTHAVFVGTHGKRMQRDRVEVLIRNLGKRAGIRKKVTPHRLRHTCATNMLRAGVPLPEVALQLGDSIQTVYNYYLHGDVEELRRQVDQKFKY
jgi:integrase